MDKSSLKRQKQEKIKLVSIPILAITLLLVIYFQHFSAPSEPVVEIPTPEKPVTVSPLPDKQTETLVLTDHSTNPTPQLSNVQPAEYEPKNWSTTALTEIEKHDPFQIAANLRPAFPESEIDDEETIEEVELDERRIDRQNQLEKAVGSKKASILITSDKGSSAVIGSKIIREGDAVEEGFMIQKIELNGVTVTLPEDSNSEIEDQVQ